MILIDDFNVVFEGRSADDWNGRLWQSWGNCKIHCAHTTYSRNNMGQKCEGNCGLRVLNELILKTYPEYLKKIVGAVWELPAK